MLPALLGGLGRATVAGGARAAVGSAARKAASAGFRGASAIGGKVVGGIRGTAAGLGRGAMSAGFSNAPGLSKIFDMLGKQNAKLFASLSANQQKTHAEQQQTNRKLDQLNKQAQAQTNAQIASNQEQQRTTDAVNKMSGTLAGSLASLASSIGGTALASTLATGIFAILNRDKIAKAVTNLDKAINTRYRTGLRGRLTGTRPRIGSTGETRMYDSTQPLRQEPEVDATGGGSKIKPNLKPVVVTDPKLQKLTEQQTDTLKKINSATSGTFKITETNYKVEKQRESQAKPTRAEKILGQAQTEFLRDFQDTTTRIFKEGLNKLIPDPGGVRVSEAAGEMYRGETVASIFKVDKVANKIFGKDYGPMFAKLGTAYLEVGASALGEAIFSGVFGAGEEGLQKSRTLFGQVLGNYKSGNKKLAAEQLIYGVTGVPTGTETIFNSMGFENTSQGVEYMANVLGAAATGIVREGTGFGEGVPNTFIDPRTGQPVTYTGLDQIFAGAAGPLSPEVQRAKAEREAMAKNVTQEQAVNIKWKGQPGTAVFVLNAEQMRPTAEATGAPFGGMFGTAGTGSISGDYASILKSGDSYGEIRDATIETPEAVYNVDESINAWGEEHEERDYSIAKEDLKTQVGVGQGIMGTFQSVGSSLMGGLSSVVNAIMSRPSGGGTSIGGIFGAPGSFTNMLGQVGTALVINKLTSKIKDPTLNLVANLGLNYAANKYLFSTAAGGASGGSILGNVFQTGGIAAFDPLNYLGALSSNIGFASGANFFAGMSSVGQGAAFPSAATYGTAGQLGYMAGQVAPYADAIIRGFRGDLGGAAASALGTYGVAQLGIAATGSTLGASAFLMANPLWAAGALILGSFLGDLFGSKPKMPVLERVIAIRNNNNPKQIITTQERHANMSDMYPGLDAMLTIAFNTAKMIEKQTGQTPFTHIGLFIRSGSDTILSLYRESEMAVMISPRGDKWGGIKYHKQFGNPQSAFKNPGTFSSQVVEFIKTSAMAELGKSEETAIAEAAKKISGKTFGELSSGELKELGLNPELNDFWGTTPEGKRLFEESLSLQKKLQEQGLTKANSFESAMEGYYEEVGYDGEAGYYTTTQRGSIGIVDAGTGQIVPYGTKITYTENGVDKTITLSRDAAGAQKVVGIYNGIPVFDVDANAGYSELDYMDFAKRVGINTSITPFLPDAPTLTAEQASATYQAETYGAKDRLTVGNAVVDQSSQQTTNYYTSSNYGTDAAFALGNIGGG